VEYDIQVRISNSVLIMQVQCQDEGNSEMKNTSLRYSNTANHLPFLPAKRL
jgi:hypothetical protein